jgi:hypothetical protein
VEGVRPVGIETDGIAFLQRRKSSTLMLRGTRKNIIVTRGTIAVATGSGPEEVPG